LHGGARRGGTGVGEGVGAGVGALLSPGGAGGTGVGCGVVTGGCVPVCDATILVVYGAVM